MPCRISIRAPDVTQRALASSASGGRKRDGIGGVAPNRQDSGRTSAASQASAISSDDREKPATKGQGKGRREEKPRNVAMDVEAHVKRLQDRSRLVFEDRAGDAQDANKFRVDWRQAPGHKVLARYRLEEQPPRAERLTEDEVTQQTAEEKKQRKIDRDEVIRKHKEKPYTDYAGLRFPTLETAESYNYHQDTGLDKLVERSFPITVPGYRRLDPYLREYIHFLHKLDPARFSISRIAERYRLREKTVAKVVKEFAVNRWLSTSGLTSLSEKQATKESVILKKKEEMYAKWVGWDQLGDEEDPGTDDEELGEFKGWRPTSDWVRRQKVEVEMMSAFPMMEKRDPMPKRVDVDMTVASHRSHKVINWLDPTDKVVF